MSGEKSCGGTDGSSNGGTDMDNGHGRTDARLAGQMRWTVRRICMDAPAGKICEKRAEKHGW